MLRWISGESCDLFSIRIPEKANNSEIGETGKSKRAGDAPTFTQVKIRM
jgi:hypothetical protein